jgi:hypothetical protein
MDLTKLEIASASDEGTRMEIYHPVTEQSFEPPIYIWVAGIDSKVWRKASMALQNKRLKKMVQKGRVKLTSTAEEIENDNVELLASCTLKWENIEWEGKKLDCNFDNAKMVYLKIAWIREAVDAFIGDRSNFLTS